MAQGASLTSFAASIDVGRQTIARWIDEHEDFRYAVTRGKAKCAAWWEKVGRDNAVSGEGNATLTVFGLTNMASEDWKKTEQVDHQSSDGSMTPKGIDTSKLSTESLRELVSLGQDTDDDRD